MTQTPSDIQPTSTPAGKHWPDFGVVLPGFVIVVLILLAYIPAMKAGFIWDDDLLLLMPNQVIHGDDGLFRIWFTTEPTDYFPITLTSHWIEYRLWGTDPAPYHLTNIVLHALGTLLLWRVLVRLRVPGAWFAAAVFAVHPVNVASVAWIVERKNVLSMVFFAATLLCWLRHEDANHSREQRGWYIAAIVLFLCALLSKTSVVMLPVVLLILAWWRRGTITTKDVLRTAPLFALSLVMGLVTIWFQHNNAMDGSAVVRPEGFASRLAAAGWAVWFYLYKALWPADLRMVYPRWDVISDRPLHWLPLISLLFVFVVAWMYRRTWARHALVGLAFVVVMLLPVLGFIDMALMRYTLVADHWQQLALIGTIATVVGIIASRVSGYVLESSAAMAIILLTLATMTYSQAQIYKDGQTLWTSELRKNPLLAVGHLNLGIVHLQEKNPIEAEKRLLRSQKLDPDATKTYLNLGALYVSQQRFIEAQQQYDELLRRHPELPEAHQDYGVLLLRQNKIEAGLASLHKALELKPDLAPANLELADRYVRQGRYEQAAEHYIWVLKVRPNEIGVLNNYGNTLAILGKLDEALTQYRKVIRLKPDHEGVYQNMAAVLLRQGRVQDAIDHMAYALSMTADSSQDHVRKGVAMLQEQKFMHAVAHFREASRRDPNNAEALAREAWILSTNDSPFLRDGARALELAKRACELTRYENPEALDVLGTSYAELGRFDEAMRAAQQALPLAETTGRAQLAQNLRMRMMLYQNRQPYHLPPQTPPEPPAAQPQGEPSPLSPLLSPAENDFPF